MNRNQDEGVSGFIKKIVWLVAAIVVASLFIGFMIGLAVGGSL